MLAMSLFSCAGSPPSTLAGKSGRLAPCGFAPNCVSSEAKDGGHQVDPLRLRVQPEEAWRVIRQQVAAMPRTHIVTSSEDYLHAECSSAWMGFVDDLELVLRPDAELVAVRSASRLGFSDMGVNRRRVESLRTSLSAAGVVAPAESR